MQFCIRLHKIGEQSKKNFCNFSIFFYCPFWLDFIAFFNALFDFQLSAERQFEMQVMLLTYSRWRWKLLHMGQSLDVRITILKCKRLFNLFFHCNCDCDLGREKGKRKDHFKTLIENYSQSISTYIHSLLNR